MRLVRPVRTIMVYMLILCLIVPYPVMGDNEPGFYVKDGMYKVNKDVVINENDRAFVRYVNDLPEGEYQVWIYADDSGGIGTKEFCGHGFIKVRRPGGVLEGYGFYPSSGSGIMGIEGMIDNDTYHKWDYKVGYTVNKTTYVNVLWEVRYWRTYYYDLFLQNCVHFVNRVSSILNEAGYDAPSGSGMTGTRPGVLADNIRDTPGSFKNLNADKTRDATLMKGPLGTWVPDPSVYRPQSPAVPAAGESAPGSGETSCCPLMESLDDLECGASQKVADVPEDIRKMAEDKPVLLMVDLEPGVRIRSGETRDTLGVVIRDSRVSMGQPVTNPGYNVYVKDRALKEIFEAKDPVALYRTALARGDIRIQPTAPGDMVLVGGAGLLNKVSLLFTPPPYMIRAGEEKELTLSGTSFTLFRPKNTILLQEKGSSSATVINSDGATQGFTTPGTARVITFSPLAHTPISGVYMHPVDEIRNKAQAGFLVPDDVRVVPPTGGMIPCTLQGGADPAHLVAGGAGFTNGYRGSR
jgi:hypothetical protein